MISKYLTIIAAVILTSFYFFPFEFVFLPGVNTKMMMAVVSLVILVVNLAKKQLGAIDKDFFVLCLFALSVSFATLFSVFYNNTRDYTYVTYIISMLVWVGGAYTLMTFIKWVHGKVSVSIMTYYLIATCVMQCLLAVAINNFPVVYSFCCSFCDGFSTMRELIGDEGRLYGVGCSFDPAGIRFAAVMVIMGYFFPKIVNKYKGKPLVVILYIVSFVIISVIGNMVARTTTVGMVMALFYVAYSLRPRTLGNVSGTNLLFKWVAFLFVISVIVIVPWYYYSYEFRKSFQFAFEGFFSLFESGKWEVHSNEMLYGSFNVLPKSLGTWIIGDGYIFDTTLDPYYIGKVYKEYYMGIDVGYLRFIFYSGVIGLGAFIIFMFKAASICMSRHKEYGLMFLLLFVLQLAVWVKVATDIFCVFALFVVFDSITSDDSPTNESGMQEA